MKLSHFIVCGLAALALPAAASAKERGGATVTEVAETSATPTTLFPGRVDLPVSEGANVPADCQYPSTLSSAASVELACLVATTDEDRQNVGVAVIAWLGANGWRSGDEIIGGFTAVKQTENGCEQVLDIFPHGDEDETGGAYGFWFALERQPRCAAAAPQAQ